MRRVYLLLTMAVIMLTGTAQVTAANEGKYLIYTTFYPTQYFAQRIGGDLVNVVNPVPQDADPHLWEPDRKTLQAYQAADLILVNGAGYEKWTVDATLPEEKLLDTSKPLKNHLIITQNAVTHSHGGSAAHSHAGINPHTWVDPVNAMIQAREIRNALVMQFPAQEAALEGRYQALLGDLDKLNRTLKTYQPDPSGASLYASHPAYVYLANRYKWNVVSLHLDPAVMPTDAQIAEIRTSLQAQPAKFMVWEAAPLAAIAERFSNELGLQSVVFMPGEVLSQEQKAAGLDYLEIMQQNVEAIRVVFQTMEANI